MNFNPWKNLPYYGPEGPGGGGGGNGDGSDAGDKSGDGDKGAEGDKGGDKGDLPEDPFKGTPFEGQKVPDKFVAEADGKKVVKAGDLLKSYTELEKAQMRRREEVTAEVRTQIESEIKARAPAAPGDYVSGEKMKFGEREGIGLKIGERELEINEADPALVFLKGVAHKYGMPKEEFPELVKGYIAAAVSAGPKWEEEAKALGGEAIAEKREQRVDGFLKANLSGENYAFFARLPSTAASIKAVEELMTLSGHPPFVPDKGDIPASTYTKAELREMQRDPRYTGEGRPGGPDKAFVAQVRAGFKKLAGGKP